MSREENTLLKYGAERYADIDVVLIAEKNFDMTDPLIKEIVETGVTIT